ncbi:MAG: DUF599 domain-containing protein [Rhodobacteraceae bacterium]|jgi:uncharacterized membrane protein|nr:DUF599 domain-containing protein [Paracoccaceae bacterium]
MDSLAFLGRVPPGDLLAVALIVGFWLFSGWLIEHPPKRRPSVTVLMQSYRQDWMRTFVTRVPRIFDATLIDSHRQGTAFFTSASMIAIGGGLALIGNSATMQEIAADLPLDTGRIEPALKLLLPVMLMANALLKFIWAHRLFGYCSILMAAVPNDPEDPGAYPRAAQAAEINITAARSYNRGLHSVYFALASLAWLFGPGALIAAALIALAVLMRREFWSHSRAVILAGDQPPPTAEP